MGRGYGKRDLYKVIDRFLHILQDNYPEFVAKQRTIGGLMTRNSVTEVPAFVRRTSTELLEKEPSMDTVESGSLCNQTTALGGSLSETISKYGRKILLKESNKKPRPSRRRDKQPTRSPNLKAKGTDCVDDWQGPAPWDLLHGGDGCPKFLCDAMVVTTFQLKISEDQIMSRCNKCNGRYIQSLLTTEEAIDAAEGFQKLPNCVFWQ